MKFLDTLRRHSSGKSAIVSDGKRYTYGDLIKDAEQLKVPSGGLYAIKQNSVYDELIHFLAAKNAVPVIVPPEYSAENVPVPQNADFAVLSSGSTGKPKLLFRTCESWADFFDEQNRAFNISYDTVILMHGSLCFTGNLNMIMGALYAGAEIVITKDRLSAKRLNDIEKYNVNNIYLVPDKLRAICRFYKGKKCVHTILAGSQSMGRNDALTLQKVFGAESVILYYGACEVSYISFLDIFAENKSENCIGKPFSGISVSCCGGNIDITSDFTVMGAPQPYRLNDIITQDNDGYLYYQGRHDDVLNIGGEKLSASALENEIKSIGSISDACIFTHNFDGREILCCAYSGDKPGILPRELTFVPKRWFKLNEIPKNANGKTDRMNIKKYLKL